MSDVLALLETSYFRNGLRLGILALAVGWALRFVVGRYRPPLPIGGILIAAATVGGLYVTEEPLGPTLPALGLILVGVFAMRLLKTPRWTHPLAAVPGALWLAFGAPVTELIWVRVLMAVLIPTAGYLITDFETRHARMGLGVIFFSLAVLGVFAAVPDTEQALVITAAVVPITLLAWPKVAVSLGAEGSYLAVAMLLWVTAAGGGARPPSIVGASACLGLLLIEPVMVAIKPAVADLAAGMRRDWLRAILASIPQFVLVVLCSRVAARFSIQLPAILVVGLAYAMTVAGVWLAVSRDRDTADDAVLWSD